MEIRAVLLLLSQRSGSRPSFSRIMFSGPTSGSKNQIQISDEATTGTTTGAKYVLLRNLRSGMLLSSIRAIIRASPVSKTSFRQAKRAVLPIALKNFVSPIRYLKFSMPTNVPRLLVVIFVKL